MEHSLEETIGLSTTELAVLGLVAWSGERSGYDLARIAARSTGFMWAPSRSQIYKVLPRLVEAGSASRREVPQRGRPDKDLYRATPAGRRALREWIERDDEPDAPFVLKLFFGWAAPPAASLRRLDTYRRVLAGRIAGWEEVRRGLAPDEPVHVGLALEHGLARARSTLEWVETAERALREG